MKRFRFKLQAVLDHRKAVEDRLQAELGEIKREEARELAKLIRLKDELDAARKGLLSAQAANATVDDLARRDEYLKAKRDEVRLQELTLEAVQAKVEAKRREVVAAMKDRKVLETLRDKQEQEYLQTVARAEQKELDDTASVRHARAA